MATKTTKRKLSILNETPPFPEGWYFVANRKDLLRRRLIEKVWMGEEIVAWCDDEGRVCVADAFCPHLGSHLGPSVGGLVRDGCLVCPFHGFEFDATGQCVATPNAPAPKAARLKVLATREILGMVFAWWGSGGRAPQWALPDEPPSGTDWSQLRFDTLRFRGHPQETTENSVDVEHLGYTHGYHDVVTTAPLATEGAYLSVRFDFKVARRIAGIVPMDIDIATAVHVHGLGYSLVEIHERTIGVHSRLWVLVTPVDGTLVEMTLVSQTREVRRPGRFLLGLGFLPRRLRRSLLNAFTLRQEKRYVFQDVAIWERKRYQSPPRLSGADGPIGKYRLYCRQFYPDLGRKPEA